MASESEKNSLQKVLFDAAVEIAVLDGTDNSTFKSLLAELKKQSESLSTSVGEIAKLYDIPAEDALEKVIDSGCRRFWWNRERCGVEGIRRLLSDLSQWDVTADIEVELTPDERQRLDEALVAEKMQTARLDSAESKPPRKFAPSDSQSPARVSHVRKQGG
jgi:hypothetical protein